MFTNRYFRFTIAIVVSAFVVASCAMPKLTTPVPATSDPNGVRVPINAWTAWNAPYVGQGEPVEIAPSDITNPTVIPLTDGVLYKLVTDYARTKKWRAGPHSYLFFIPKNLQPYFMGVEGDTSVRLCLTSGGRLSDKFNILWMGTRDGNGTSGFVRFEKTDVNPPLDTATCQES